MKNVKKALALILSVSLILGAIPTIFASAESSENLGTYSNDFNVDGDLSIIIKDFNLYYDTFDTGENSLKNITSDPSKYMTFANNRLERVRDDSELGYWNDGNRPYWCMAYYTYKNQTFKNFTLTVDAYFPTWGNTYNAITVGSMGGGLKNNGGFTLGFFNSADDVLTVYLGNAADVAVNFNDWYVHDCTGKGTYAHENGNYNFPITLTVSGGKATVSIDGTTVLTDIEVGEISGYVSLVNGLASGSYYDNLTIIETRIEEEGKYSSGFNFNGDLSKITNDFNLYYDTSDSGLNTMSDITSDPSKYMTFANNRLERIRDDSELDLWHDGNRPYWCMAYYTYKNQTFKNFKLTVDAYMPMWGSNYNAITVGGMGNGLKSNNGFTLGFQNISETQTDIYIGGVDDIKINFDDWYIHDCVGKYKMSHESGDYNFKIDLYVKNSKVTLKINGKIIFENITVRRTDGYISLVNGLASGSYYDNLSIVSLGDEQMNCLSVNNSVVSISMDDVTDVSEIGVLLSYSGSEGSSSYQIATTYANGDSLGGVPYYATKENVYYCDVNKNGIMGSDDLVFLKKIMLGNESDSNDRSADANTDGRIDIRDLVRLKKVFASEKITTDYTGNMYNYAFCIPESVWNADTIEIQPYFVSAGYSRRFEKYKYSLSGVEWRNPSSIEKISRGNKKVTLRTSFGSDCQNLYISFPNEGGIRICTDSEGVFTPETLKSITYNEESTGTLLIKSDDCSVRLNYGSSPWTLEFLDKNGACVHNLSAEQMLLGYRNGIECRVKLKGQVVENEVIYGLGERYNSFNQVGKKIKLWNTDTGYHGADEYSEKTLSYTNVPILHSNRGYTLYFNSMFGGTADIACSVSDEYSLEFSGTDFDFYVYTGTPLENITAYTSLTGKPFTAPKWAFSYWAGNTAGYWNSENEEAFSENVTQALKKYNDMGTLPSAIYLEGLNGTNLSVIDIANSYGVRPLIWENPCITLSHGGLSLGDLRSLLPGIKDFDLPSPHSYDNLRIMDYWGDFSNPLIKKALKNGGFDEFIQKGLRGAMVDYGEYIDENMSFSNGMKGSEMHNYYPYVYNKTVNEIFKETLGNDFVLFARAGCAGSQSFAGSFGGDQPSSFYGLRMAYYGGLTLSASGFSNWGSDIGGLCDTPSEQLYMRWLEFATFSPFMRAHGTGREPWLFGDNAVNAFTKYYWLRENLLDYIYSANLKAGTSGIPMMRSMAVAFPEETELAAVYDQYMFGDSILVCPILEENTYLRKVTLPKGNWIDFWTGKTYSGGTIITVVALSDKIPVFIRGGSVIKTEVSEDYTFCSDMNSGRYDALVVSNGTQESSYFVDNGEYKFQSENISGGFSISNLNSEGSSILIAFGTNASSVTVDGKELSKLSSKPSDPSVSGWFIDDNNRTVIFTGGSWEKVSVF